LKIHFGNEKSPSQLDYLRVLNNRGHKKDQYLLNSLEKGNRGEEIVIDFLKQYGEDHWVILRNLWLDYNGTFEVDILLLTNHGPYVFEIKNYEGVFEYIDGDCFRDGTLLSHNPIAQAKRAYINVQTICSLFSRSLKAFGTLIFAGEHNQVKINSKIAHINIIPYNGLKKYIQNIAKKDKQHYNQIATEGINAFLRKYQIQNPYLPRPISVKEMEQLKKGIYCNQCKSFNLSFGRRYIKCHCNYKELRDEAMIRTIREYCLLNYDKKIYKKDIMRFLGKDASPSYIYKILKKHFKFVKNGAYSYYKNIFTEI